MRILARVHFRNADNIIQILLPVHYNVSSGKSLLHTEAVMCNCRLHISVVRTHYLKLNSLLSFSLTFYKLSLPVKYANPYGVSVRITEFDLFHSLTAVGPKSYGYKIILRYKIFWVNIFFYRVKMAEIAKDLRFFLNILYFSCTGRSLASLARLGEASRESRETTLAKSRDTREMWRKYPTMYRKLAGTKTKTGAQSAAEM